MKSVHLGSVNRFKDQTLLGLFWAKVFFELQYNYKDFSSSKLDDSQMFENRGFVLLFEYMIFVILYRSTNLWQAYYSTTDTSIYIYLALYENRAQNSDLTVHIAK